MKYFFTGLTILLSILNAHSQTATISGTLRDAETGETLIGANVYIVELTTGTSSNTYGFYSINVSKNKEMTIQFTYAGYQTIEKKINVSEDQKMDIELTAGEQLNEVVVSAESNKEIINNTQMSVTTLSAKEAKKLPALFGEVDILKTLQLKPGVQSGGEGTSGIFVRGGGPDQNLFILDEATVYNASHLFGFFSTFNSDAVKDVELYKGGFPAEYGGRLSSVIDVRLRDGNRKKLSGTGGIGLIASRLTLEGPIVRDKGSFILSGRRTYADLITNGINEAQANNPDFNPIPAYYFYDLNGKMNYDLGENDRLYLSGYLGRDFFRFAGGGDFDFNFNWGNITTTARWNHVFTPKLFMNTTFTFSDYDYTLSNAFGEFEFELGSGIRDRAGKVDFSYKPNNSHFIQFGVASTFHTFDVGRVQAGSEDSTIAFSAGQSFDAWDFAAYVADEWEVNDKIKLDFGLRFSGFYNDGQFYSGIEPRIASKFSLSDNVSLKASYARMYQYIHLVSNSGASLPTDVWYPSDNVVQPQSSDQLALGVNIALGENYILSNEIYYKWLYNQVDFKDNANLFVNDELNQEFVFGKGWTYGNEVYIEKTKGDLTGWIGYTLSYSWRQFDDILMGAQFPYRNDRRHDISIVAMYEINKRLTVTGSWVYSTGNAATVPIGYFVLQNPSGQNFQIVPIFVERNSYRMPAYHRMDLGLVWILRKRKFLESDLTFSIYNTYYRRNPYLIFVDDNRQELLEASGNTTLTLEDFEKLEFSAQQISLFPIIPSVTWNFKF
jgi:hypothetical protein